MKLSVTILALAAAVVATPVPQGSYKDYGSYKDVKAPAGGYGKYGDYKGVPSPPVASPAPPAGGYGSYGTYKPPAGGYGSYKGYKREDAGPEGPVEDEA